MFMCGRGRDSELAGDVAIGGAACNQPQRVDFALGQSERRSCKSVLRNQIAQPLVKTLREHRQR
jgi:hypothetical protein